MVGANSTGKSSILKFFPLLKQSVKATAMVNGVVKWMDVDDPNAVDFGDYENTVSNKDKTKSIDLELGFSSDKNDTFTISESICFDEKCGERIGYFSLHNRTENNNFVLSTDIERSNNNELKNIVRSNEDHYNLSKLRQFKNANFEIDGKGEEVNLVPKLRFMGKDFLISAKEQPSLYEEMHELYLNSQKEFENLKKNIFYIQPLRMDVKRNYALSNNLSSEELFSDASNIAYYLNKLNPEEKSALNEWLKENGFELEIDFSKFESASVSGQLEVFVKTNNMAESRNIVDLGFGFSQILPILVLIWNSVRRVSVDGFRVSDYSKIIVIEQPEVHLHPKFIGKFATIISKTISYCKEKDIAINFIVETHSFSLLNKIGTLVYKNDISRDLINVLMFEQNENGLSEVKSKNYDEEGALTEWPYDFFDED